MLVCPFFFFFNDTATTEIYTLSLHDALPIWMSLSSSPRRSASACTVARSPILASDLVRSEEHTSELQSLAYLVCRLLLEKKKHVSVDKDETASHTPKYEPPIRNTLTLSRDGA